MEQSDDNHVTSVFSNKDMLHNWQMENDPEYAKNDAINQWYNESVKKQALQDQSLVMAMAAQGPGSLATYSMAPIHSAARVSRAIQYKDPMRATGIPSKKFIASAFKNGGKDRDKFLWQGTGNATKLNALMQE